MWIIEKKVFFYIKIWRNFKKIYYEKFEIYYWFADIKYQSFVKTRILIQKKYKWKKISMNKISFGIKIKLKQHM